MLTQENLKKVLNYDKETGIFTRIKTGEIAGCLTPKGYLFISVENKRYQAHRLAWLYVYGYMPENGIDHINRIKNDNKIINLRECKQQCNIVNSDNRRDNTSGVKGICFDKQKNKWRSAIMVDGKQIHLGYFMDKLIAAKARLEAEIKYGWENYNSNSPAYQYVIGCK